MEYARVATTIQAPIGQLWAVLAGFGALAFWCPAIKSCALEGEGVGAIRTVHMKDAIHAAPQCEQLVQIDPQAHRMSYKLLQPSLLPLSNVHSTMELLARSPGVTEFVWTSACDPEPAPSREISALIEAFYRESAENLKAILEPDET